MNKITESAIQNFVDNNDGINLNNVKRFFGRSCKRKDNRMSIENIFHEHWRKRHLRGPFSVDFPRMREDQAGIIKLLEGKK